MSDFLMDDEAQRLFISSMLGTPAMFARVQHLLDSSYFDKGLQEGVAFLKTFFNEHRGVPSEVVFKASTKLDLRPVELPPQDQQFVAEQIALFCQIRAVTQAVLKAPGFIESGDFGRMLNEIKSATQIQLHTDLGIDYFENPEARLMESEAAEVLIPTGWVSVDELIQGLGRQELILFTANSGGGKSVGMLNMAFNLLSQSLNGVYISLEMRDRVVAKRLDSMISKIAGRQIFTNKLKVGEEIQAFKEASKSRFFVKRMREGTTNANHIIAYLRELEAVHGFRPDFVVVDYLDLMASTQKHDGSNMFTKDKYVAEEVRAIGFDFDCIMISASQLGRGAIQASREGEALGQDHIQGGMSKINTADLVIAMVKTEAMAAAGEYRFEFLKSRNSGAVGKHLVMRWDENSLRITDAPGISEQISTFKKRPALGDVKPGQKKDGLSELIGRG